MTIIVTGAAGFIGANNVKALNEQGERDIVAVDHLAQADKFHNLVDSDIADYLDKHDFLDALRRRTPATRRRRFSSRRVFGHDGD